MTKFLVTGSEGFLGTEIVKNLLKKDFDVIGMDIQKSTLEDPRYTFVNSGISEDCLLNLPYEPKVIIHTASSLPYGGTSNTFKLNNIETARIISEYAADKSIFVVEVSSSSVYGKPSIVPISKNSRLNPLDEYAKSKIESEKIFIRNLKYENLAIIRPRTILGAQRAGIFDIFFKMINLNVPIPLPNAGNQIIQFVHVKDLSRFCIFLALNKTYGIWPAGSNNPLSLREYLEKSKARSGKTIRYIPVNEKLFYAIGAFLYHMKLTKFTPWHFGAFPSDNYFSEEWRPDNFEFEYSCLDAFDDTWQDFNARQRRLFTNPIRIGKKIV
jgi:nucleoside-diphosphate-sugar epimerase